MVQNPQRQAPELRESLPRVITAYKNRDHYDGAVVETCQRINHGWSREQHRLAWNGNTGAMACNLAARLGAAKIILLGFDMQLSRDGGAANWHPNLKNKPDGAVYPKFIRHFREVRDGCSAEGIEVLNANPESALPYFPRVTIEEAMRRA